MPQQHQQQMGGGGFAPAGQQFQTADGQTRQFGGAGHGPAPMFEQQQHARHNHAGLGAGAGMAAAPNTGNVSGHTGTLHRGAGAMGTSERNGLPNPMNVQAAPEGGVSVDGRAGLPLGRPTVGDKMVGKMEQGMGKMVGDWKMQNQGELRATGGKAAAAGQARAPIQ
ncbi:hypothetical protein EXIGLDRAFT_719558 [Exidia glandulosa HHB12029]|uniref:Uncharacterized protein n=1 Tax=Exidia glandulosa HHB12029 TaxID=1314781 RepID=A0A165H0M5_EXIGL|nr:hypothetical protein EXIGLDRAFT_719558 [Exidia glandulosa HHB12029]